MNALLETTELRPVPEVITPHCTNTVMANGSSALSPMLDSICEFLRRYIVFASSEQPVAIALWVAHTWALKAFDYTPYLHVASPEKRCGKTRLLDCIELLTLKPWRAISPSEAVLFRKIEKDQPTLLLDEVDAIFCNGKDEKKELLRALLNAGFERNATIPRCAGQNFEVKDFSVFCAKALAGIGRLPDTVSDRCIPIRLVRRTQNEKIGRFRRREAFEAAETIVGNLAQWAEADETLTALRNARPDVPEQLGDRQADICEPLLAIADLAGEDWPDRSRFSLGTLCAGGLEEDDSLGVKLLADIREIFDEAGADKISTKDILDGLIDADDDAPWPIWWEHEVKDGNTRGSAAKLAKLLKPYGIAARVIRLPDGSTPRGYRVEDFAESWKRYCPSQQPPDATTQQNSEFPL